MNELIGLVVGFFLSLMPILGHFVAQSLQSVAVRGAVATVL